MEAVKGAVKVEQKTSNPATNIALDTVKIGKQALVFVGTRQSAEKAAEEIARHLKLNSETQVEHGSTGPSRQLATRELAVVADEALHALSRPTRQCERLARCIKGGTAFHHSGLVAKQRQLIEENFRNGVIKIICCTPTLCISKTTKLWHGVSETEVFKLKTSHPLFVLSKEKLVSMKAQKIQKVDNSEKLIQISSVSGYTIKVTPNHKMLIKRNNQKMVLEARLITKKDKIATIGKLNIRYAKVPSFNDFVTENRLCVINYKFAPEFSYLIGAMLGDGYSGAETVNGKILYKGSPALVGVDQEIFLQVREACLKLGISFKESRNYHGTPQLVLGKNKWFREFLVKCGVEKGDKKYVSDKLRVMSLDNVSWLLKGLFDTDGYVQKDVCVGFSNISEILVKQIQKLLLRFGIVSRIRERKESSMRIYEKKYKTKVSFELTICQKSSIIDFYKFIGFNVKRKQRALSYLITQIHSNVNYISCAKCKYKIYSDIFSGRASVHKKWGMIKLKVIKLLGIKGELGSRQLRNLLNAEARKKERRLNHHYELIIKRRTGNRANTELFWSLNRIGKWIFTNLINKNIDISEFFKLKECPLCKRQLEFIIKKGWRSSDFEGDIFWDIIREIKESDCEKDVYDVVLPVHPESAHMFLANGFIVHNSAGVDLPAYRAVIRDLKRFSDRTEYGYGGSNWIPVLEYLQMCGRAGRPSFDSEGQAILLADSESESEEVTGRYIFGEPEEIFSKLAVEPVLRTYLLSLIATRLVGNREEVMGFFSRTFWAHQYKDFKQLEKTIDKMLFLLEEWEFIRTVQGKTADFTSAADMKSGAVMPTLIGTRVAELYLDPLTAHEIMLGLTKRLLPKEGLNPFPLLQLVSSRLEMRPLLRVKVREVEEIQQALAEYAETLLVEEPSMFEEGYEDFLASVKTAMFFNEWIDEKDEEYLLEKYGIRPGEIHAKLGNADWLLYSAAEIAKLIQLQPLLKHVAKLRFRVEHGIKEELLPLTQLKGIGRVRARKLFDNRIRNLGDVKAADTGTLTQILGSGKLALDIKQQLGEKVEVVKEGKRKGQINLKDYGD